MRDKRTKVTLALFVLVALISLILPQVRISTDLTQSYGITTCPSAVNGARGTALLPSRSIGVRELERKNSGFTRSPLGTRSLSNGSLIVSGSPTSAITLQSKSGKWTGAVTCTSGETSSWFVGGTANVSSQGKLLLVNSGLSGATVEVTGYSENGPSQPMSFTIKALSERVVKIDTLEPGAKRLVIRVKVVNGRVTSFLTDERVRGLVNIGGDYVTPISKPSQELIIAGIPASFGSSSKVAHTLRIMTTSDIDASASVEVISSTGVFVPVGLGNIDLNGREVVDLKMDKADLGRKPFAIKITASSPIVAGVFTEVRRGSVSDFLWASASSQIRKASFNLYGLEPVISFVGDKISVDIQWRTRTGKTKKTSITGSEIANWTVPSDSRLISIKSKGGVSAGMSWITTDGVAHIPIVTPTSLASAPRPISDIAVIQSRT